jgi:hypothetical protein
LKCWFLDKNGNPRSLSWIGCRSNKYCDIKAVKDIDGDGTADIIWQQTGTESDSRMGDIYLWCLNTDGSIKSSCLVRKDLINADIIAVGKIDADNTVDLVLRYSSGQVECWLLNSNCTFKSAVSIDSVPQNWVLRTTGDIDGNGAFDLIWEVRSGTVWYCWYWLLNPNGTLKSKGPVMPVPILNIWTKKGSGL